MKMKFLLDTNFLMAPGQLKVDVFEQLRRMGPAEFYVSSLSVKELMKLAKGSRRDSAAARIALILVRREGVKVIPAGNARGADDAIVRASRSGTMAVCTMDKALKASLRRRGVKTLSVRQKKYVDFD